MLYVTNAFSINMIANADVRLVNFDHISTERAQKTIDRNANSLIWAIGHTDTSRVVSATLGIDDPGANRINVSLGHDDVIIVAQYTGQRLPEGATTLPEGATITFWEVMGMD